MELQPDNRPETIEEWLKELSLNTVNLSFPKLLWTQPLWARILEIMGVIALFAALISGIKDGTDLLKDWFPDKSTPTNPTSQPISCSTFKLHILGGQDAHPTRVIFNSIMQIRCFLAYHLALNHKIGNNIKST